MTTGVDGYVEEVTSSYVKGWATAPVAARSVSILLRRNGETLARTTPVFRRTDVEDSLHTSEPTGFSLAYANIRELLLHGDATIEVALPDTDPQPLTFVEGALTTMPSQYQSFGAGDEGHSHSAQKLEKLRLDLLSFDTSRPVRVLDLGCNEGYFCDAVSRRFGDAAAVGVDRSGEFLALAKQRFPHVEFRQQGWWDVEDGNYDIILFLSAAHYEKDQERLFRFLSQKLSDRGVLVLECGVGQSPLLAPETKWVIAHRADGHIRYPTLSHLESTLLAPFSVKYVGESVQQHGDPVSRHVFHCRKQRQHLVLLGGHSGRGKTELAANLSGSRDVQVLYSDLAIMRLMDGPYLETSPLAFHLRRIFSWPCDIRQIQQCLVDHELIGDFVDLLVLAIDPWVPTVVIEGDFLSSDVMIDKLVERLGQDMCIWRFLDDGQARQIAGAPYADRSTHAQPRELAESAAPFG